MRIGALFSRAYRPGGMITHQHSAITLHPVIMAGASAASLTALLGPFSNYLLAVPGAILATVMLGQMVANSPGFLGIIISRVLAVWYADRPYIAMLGGFGFAAAQYFQIPIPDYVVTLAAFIGIGNLHASTKPRT